MDNIIEPTIDYDFSKLYLGPPATLSGGAYFTRIMYNTNKSIYIQTPKSLTKQGFIKSGKKIYTDLMFDNNDTVFINWIENLETKCQELIFNKGQSWFENKLEKDGSVLLEGIGTFTKFSNGKLDFYPITIDPVFIPDIKVEKAVIKEPVQEIFKEDKQTTDIEIDEYFNTNETTFERWKISAIVLLSISLLLIIIYISQRGFNLFGNIGSY